MNVKKKSPNILQDIEKTFNYLKRFQDEELRNILATSEFKHFTKLKEEMLNDPDWCAYLEKRMNKINHDRRTKNYINKTSGNKKFVEKGTKNLRKLTSDSVHQRKANKASQEAKKIINKERLDGLISFILEALPTEFSHSHIIDIVNNNTDNTLFQKSHSNSRPVRTSTIVRKFLKNAKSRDLIVSIKAGNQFEPSIFHKINSIGESIESTYSYEECFEAYFG